MKKETYLPLFSGFYGSHWDEPDFYGEDEYFNLPKDMEFWEFIDWDAYHTHIAEKMTDKVEELLEDFVESIEFQSVCSPKYYNYSNDSINVVVEFDENVLIEYIKDNGEEFDKYIKDNYSSYDGFVSFHSSNSIEWLDEWLEDKHKVGSVLQFICENEGLEEPWDLDDCHYSLFYKEEIDKYRIL